MTVMTPSAIWLYLAQFFTREVLVGLMDNFYSQQSKIDQDNQQSNSLLLQRVNELVDEQYREVELGFLDLADGTAERLRNPAVSRRVRVLRIGPYFVRDALDSHCGAPFEDTLIAARELLTRLNDVEEYHIRWHELPTTFLRPLELQCDDNLSNMFCAATSFLTVPFTFAPSLRTLTIEFALDKTEHVFLPTVVLPSLSELNLCVRSDHAGDLDAAGYAMVHHLARFMNNAHRTLTSLSFETSLGHDFSPLFSALVPFPRLSTLALAIPTARPHLGDPVALNGFLRDQSDTVAHLSLRGFNSTTRRQSVDAAWFSECLEGLAFPALRTLDVRTAFIPLDSAVPCALDLCGTYLSYEDVEAVLHGFGDRLQTLRLFVTCLTPELVDMLSDAVPGLVGLDVRISYVNAVVPPQCKETQLARFCEAMDKRTYAGWKLRDVKIWMFSPKLRLQRRCVDAVLGSIVRSR
ncbi:hypothetical protein C8J57DRAFT_1299257 [Mycena rebaudengoi]|nr:hypothetical protein C8J57DRAFT_1299257 [Mycena rebaudengoi]